MATRKTAPAEPVDDKVEPAPADTVTVTNGQETLTIHTPTASALAALKSLGWEIIQ